VRRKVDGKKGGWKERWIGRKVDRKKGGWEERRMNHRASVQVHPQLADLNAVEDGKVGVKAGVREVLLGMNPTGCIIPRMAAAWIAWPRSRRSS
jgi:hypothetical protein